MQKRIGEEEGKPHGRLSTVINNNGVGFKVIRTMIMELAFKGIENVKI
jgi:hypothetical protein